MSPPLSGDNQTKLNLMKQMAQNQYLGRDDPIVKRIIQDANNETLRENLK